jgi:hypothetical protein
MMGTGSGENRQWDHYHGDDPVRSCDGWPRCWDAVVEIARLFFEGVKWIA